MNNLAINELLRNIDKQSFGTGEEREERIKNFMNNHPEFFQWFFEKEEGTNIYHSKNLLTSDLANAFTTNLKLTDLMPGTRIRLVFSEDGKFTVNENNYEDIIIGATGNYFADEIKPVYGIYFIKDALNESDYPISLNGSFSYQYQVPIRNSFDSITNITTNVETNEQIIGPIEDLMNYFNCSKRQVTKISMSRYFKRPVEYLFYKNQDLINFEENIFKPGYVNNYKQLKNAYEGKLYWDTSYTGTFDEKEHMEYSPFSIYVLRNSSITIKGEEQDIISHIKHSIEETSETHTHVANHMFEKYYIDRYINAKTAEDMLTERMSLVARIENSKNEEEKTILKKVLNDKPLYVLDPIAGKVYKAGKNYFYNPTIVYNNEQIDLREIQRYDLDNLDSSDTKISVGNGVYGDIFYQTVEMEYSFEQSNDTINNLVNAKSKYYTLLNQLENRKNGNGEDITREELDRLDSYYKMYNDILAETIENWTTKETHIKEE